MTMNTGNTPERTASGIPRRCPLVVRQRRRFRDVPCRQRGHHPLARGRNRRLLQRDGPVPWALHALTWLQQAPDVPFGVHLTSVSEQPAYRWGPITCRTEVPSLVDETGYFYPESRIDEFLDQVDVTELELEYRAQIEHVLGVGLQPTHLDSHCAIHTRREGFEMTLGLARQYGVPLRAYYRPFIERMRQRGYPTMITS